MKAGAAQAAGATAAALPAPRWLGATAQGGGEAPLLHVIKVPSQRAPGRSLEPHTEGMARGLWCWPGAGMGWAAQAALVGSMQPHAESQLHGHLQQA